MVHTIAVQKTVTTRPKRWYPERDWFWPQGIVDLYLLIYTYTNVFSCRYIDKLQFGYIAMSGSRCTHNLPVPNPITLAILYYYILYVYTIFNSPKGYLSLPIHNHFTE